MTINPKTGRTDRNFRYIWQAVRYEIGYSAQKTFLPTESYADEFYRLGKQDAKAEQLQERVKLATRMREHYKPDTRTDLSGVLIVVGCCLFVLAVWLYAMTTDYRMLP